MFDFLEFVLKLLLILLVPPALIYILARVVSVAWFRTRKEYDDTFRRSGDVTDENEENGEENQSW